MSYTIIPYCKVLQDYNHKLSQLYDEKIALYERMLKEKDKIMARLEKLLEKK